MRAVAAVPGAFYLLWLFYLAATNLYRARCAGTITRTATVLGWPIVVAGLALDVALNIVIVSIVLLEIPREWTITARLDRHFHESTGWRRAVAAWIGATLLNAFDPSGAHIK